jgi:hypothetical protein
MFLDKLSEETSLQNITFPKKGRGDLYTIAYKKADRNSW